MSGGKRYASIFRSDLFAGRCALVTGGGSGIGRAIAHELAFLGAKVAIAGRDEAKVAAVAAEIREDGGIAEPFRCDVRDEAQVEVLVEGVVARLGGLELLVNNAGGQFLSPVAEISPKGFRAVLETNLTGTWLVSRAAYKRAMQERGGAVVNIVADMWRGMPMMAHSGAARAGVVNLTMSCAIEWAPAGVRVNAVAPGYIASSGLTRYPDYVQEMLPKLVEDTPARRFGTEAEVAAAVVFLLSPAAAFVNGETLRVDGASSLYRQAFPIPEHPPHVAFEGFHRAPSLPEALRAANRT